VLVCCFAALLLASPIRARSPHHTNPPVARPVDPDKTASSRVVVAIQPVGKLPYDGITLPLISPDGLHFATQSGRTPSWETLFALRGQSAPSGLRISTYQLEFPTPPAPGTEPPKPDPKKPPRTASISPLRHDEPPRSGLLLGRAADNRGFLIEAPQPPDPGTGDAAGARSIGRISWLTGKLEWLIRDGRVNAHAVLPPDASPATLAFVRREPAAASFHLVVRTRNREDAVGIRTELVQSTGAPDVTFAFPFFSADGRTLAALSLPANDAEGLLQLCAFELVTGDEGQSLLRPLGRLDLGRTPGGMTAFHTAYQCVASLQSPAVLPTLAAGIESSPARALFSRGLIAFSPRDSAMLWWQPHDDRSLTLARGSFAAAPFQHDAFGLVMAGPGSPKPLKPGRSGGGAGGEASSGDLLYQPFRLNVDREPPEPSLGREVAVVAGGSIPRATTLSGGVTVLLASPRSGSQNTFDVLLMAPAKPE